MKVRTAASLVNVGDNSLARYLAQINKFPVLAADEEYMLAKRYQEHSDLEAAHKLVSSHLRLVAKIAMGFRGYGLPIGEVISEGNIGLMQAVKKFEPDKGFRLATYAMWWIKAAIQEYVLRSWSLVKLGTTTNQKKLFFNLRKIKNKISAFDDQGLNEEQIKLIANNLNVSEQEVVSMNQRLGGDSSLNATVKSGEGESLQWQDWLVDDKQNQEEILIDENEKAYQHKMLNKAIEQLTQREADIFRARRLNEKTTTLEELALDFGVSRERVRQIEVRAFEKVQNFMREHSGV
ncbi:RNA polymerase sigma factor RpoH [Bartonella sp. TP]|uniref:RNA polymerase sigma factor RpoH n=1 Tax=Bartonella sp. TP TaxID=3057550 RepID=UPI0025B14614|nr:RNA polymerase sigma factor RpoH [Bartonella sp. TP]MDN5248877.1 RNA polymerase sigma factor RpoH [Alphaproteobacteria bacterium]WJW79599.1 RNA polymerase sigma factor RpoH [Bartonella sp. TP]